MNNFNIKDYQIKTSRSGEHVPVVNGIHLHSVYDPKKEARSLIANNKDVLKKHSKILILGLGFAYHVEEIITELKKLYKHFQVVVIEPNEQLSIDCQHYNSLKTSNCKIYVESDICELYRNIGLVDFLSDRPGVIAHPASFNLNNNFFRNFLTYKSDQKLSSVNTNFINKELKDFFAEKSLDQTLNQNISDYLKDKNQITSRLDFLIMAYQTLIPDQSKDQPEEK